MTESVLLIPIMRCNKVIIKNKKKVRGVGEKQEFIRVLKDRNGSR